MFAAEANASLSREEQDVIDAAVKAENSNCSELFAEKGDAVQNDNEVSIKSSPSLVHSAAQIAGETEEVDPEEVKRDRMVEQVIISSVSGGSMFKSRQSCDDVKKEVTEKLAAMGVEVKRLALMQIERENTRQMLRPFHRLT